MSQARLIVASRRVFLRDGAAALSGAVVALLAGREALAQSATMSHANLHEFAQPSFERSAMPVSPTVKPGGRVRRHWFAFSSSRARWTTGIPSTPTGSLKTVPWCSWTIEG